MVMLPSWLSELNYSNKLSFPLFPRSEGCIWNVTEFSIIAVSRKHSFDFFYHNQHWWHGAKIIKKSCLLAFIDILIVPTVISKTSIGLVKSTVLLFCPFKSLRDQIWLCRKIGHGQPRVIIWIDLVVFSNLTYQVSRQLAKRFLRRRF